jgi:hypothetical protein
LRRWPLRCIGTGETLISSWRIPLTAIACVLGALLATVDGQVARPATPPPAAAGRIEPAPPGHHFPDGQAYVYDVEWRLWTAGMAVLRIDTEGAEQHVRGSGNSTGTAGLLYHVDDRFDAWLNAQTFCSRRIQKHIEEGARRVESTTDFDYARKQAVLNQFNLKKGDRKHVEHPIPDCVTDVISAIYYTASLPLTVGSSYEFPLNDGGDTVTVKVKAEARETVKTPAGTFSTVRVQPTASAGVLKDRGKVWVWYTDDAQRIPVQMRARMGWGTLTFRLARVDK